jgi:mono/diheme cytochrome c family protein
MSDTPARFALRQLPLPARLVISGFLLSVGVGYFSALVQLHMQHGSRDGQPLPSPADVVEVFAGLKKVDLTAPPPVSKLERLVTGPLDAAWNGSGSMAAAFYHKDDGEYRRAVKDDPAAKAKIDAERAGEQAAVAAWCRLPDADRRKAYEADAVPHPADAPLTEDYRTEDKANAKVKAILTDRCARCHQKGADQEGYPLEAYEQFTKYLQVPTLETLPGGWVRSDRQVSVEKLTQSTHAHLLSFAVLFSLTGLVFAFTHYPLAVRCVVAPLVLAAQMADVACWWLARVDGVGPLFAQAIVGTGTVVGLGLLTHIGGGLWSLYGRAGRGVLVAFALIAGGGFAVLYSAVLHPALQAEKASKLAPAATAPAAER